jgi:hypothetical protein
VHEQGQGQGQGQDQEHVKRSHQVNRHH